jgi:AcrR family transcriptional regulator
MSQSRVEPRGARAAPKAADGRSRRRRTASKKRAMLVETAIELFKRYGMKRVTVAEICQQAGVSKVTFYKYFTDKIALAKEVIGALSDAIVRRIDEIDGLEEPFPRKAELLVDERVRMAREWSPDFIEELYHADDELAELVAERVRGTRDRYEQFIRRAQAAGEVRPDLQPEVVLAVLDKLRELGGDEDLVRRAGGYEPLTRDVNNVFFYGITRR